MIVQKRFFPYLFLVMILCACAPAMKQVPHEDPTSLYNMALAQENSGNLNGAYQSFIHLWKTFPKHELGSKALFNAAAIIARTDSDKAVDLYQTFIKTYPDSAFSAKVKSALLDQYSKRKNYTEAQRLFTDLFSPETGAAMVRPGTEISMGLIEAGQYPLALETIASIYPFADQDSRHILLSLWTSAVENIDQIAVLEQLETATTEDQLIEVLLARQARLYLEQEDKDIAARIMERLRNKAMQLSLEERFGRNTIGVVVPLTGKWEAVGQKVLKGIAFASRVFSDEKAPNVEYVIRDYGDDESSIPGIIEDLDKNHEVISIIGPIGETAGSISCDEAQKRGIPSFMFTRGDIGSPQDSCCFRNFISVDIQVHTLLQVAADLNIKRFAILYPTDHFGNIFTKSFIENSQTYGIEIVRQVGYSPQLVDFKEAVNTLIAHLKPPEHDKAQEEAIGTDQEEDMRIEPDFDALLIPDTAINAAMIASYLPYFSIEGVRLFGPTLWDTTDFTRVGGKYVDDAIFISGFFINSQLDFVQEFNNSFYYTFGYSPSVWEASAYDTALILQNLLEGELHTRESLREQIASVKDYPGLTGSTSFFSDGSVDKAIYVLTVKGGNIYEIVP